MAYLPKNKYKVLYTRGNTFKLQSTGKPYTGNYIKLSDGRLFAGSNPNDLRGKLLPIIEYQNKNILLDNRNNRVYQILDKQKAKEQDDAIIRSRNVSRGGSRMGSMAPSLNQSPANSSNYLAGLTKNLTSTMNSTVGKLNNMGVTSQTAAATTTNDVNKPLNPNSASTNNQINLPSQKQQQPIRATK